MTEAERQRWAVIQQFELDDHASALPFSDRLARENGWSKTFALRAVEEYKKFMFLVATTDSPLTPSDEVDQVWHLHLLYTRSYWKEFCAVVLQKEIHHGPTTGGASQRDQFTAWYNDTLQCYRDMFQMEPPADLWPTAAVRFKATNFQRVDIQKHWIIKKPYL
ncbi:glycine-rich domain-containing protein [Dawidia soli]|uniref:Uncharacterized protein n=1 Tax=Dawidia soli TaxID=2782352 RepID=A0AAP2DD11_9BACT|nr:hypothetical protein [Dawidia soli]MBT1689911.1 hypothetical protein [Dawidia soli]